MASTKKVHVCYEFNFTYRFPSLNEWYSGKHWRIRSNQKDVLKKYFFGHIAELITNKVHLIEFEIEMEYNNRIDTDNNIPCIKIFVDTLRAYGIIANDSGKFFKSLRITYNNKLKNNESNIKLKGVLK